MKKQSFLIGAIILALGGFIAKAVGAVYKIPLTHILGTTGIGIYYLVFPVYSIMLTLSSSGISSAVNILVAKERLRHNRKNEFVYLRVSIIITFVVSVFWSILVVLLSKDIVYMQGNTNAHLSLIAVTPAIMLASLIAVVRGYFQGIENMIPTSVSMILEQIVKMVVGLLIAYYSIPYGVEYAVLGAVLGVTMSEIVALIIIVINFVIYKVKLDKNIIYYRENYISDYAKKQLHIKEKIYKANNKISGVYVKKHISHIDAVINISRLAIPTTLVKIVLPGITLLDSFVIINMLINGGYTSTTATAMYGIYSGIVSSIVSMAVIVISAVTTALIPKLNKCESREDMRSSVRFSYKVIIYISLILVSLYILNASDIISILYGDTLSQVVFDEYDISVKLLMISSVSILYSALLHGGIVILQSIGKTGLSFVILVVFVVFRYVGIYVLMSLGVGIYAVEIASSMYIGVCSMMMIVIIKRYIGFSMDISYVIYGVCSTIALLLIAIPIKSVLSILLTPIWSAGIVTLIVLCSHVIFFLKCKIFSENEKNMILKYRKKKVLVVEK